MKNFLQVDKTLIYSSDLTCDEKIVLMALIDRWGLSKTQGNHFKENGQFFVRYSQQEMAKVINKSPRTVFSIYQTLENKMIISRKKNRNASDSIFLTGIAKFASCNSQEVQTNNNNLNNNNLNNTSDTINTEKPKKSKVNDTTISTSSFSKLKQWEVAVKGKMKLHLEVVDAIKSVSNNDFEKCYKLTGIMNNAKRHVEIRYRFEERNRKVLTRYECNMNLVTRLRDRILYAATKLPQGEEARDKYWTRVFINFFEWAFGITSFNVDVNPAVGDGTLSDKIYYEHEIRNAQRKIYGMPTNEPKIPTFKIR